MKKRNLTKIMSRKLHIIAAVVAALASTAYAQPQTKSASLGVKVAGTIDTNPWGQETGNIVLTETFKHTFAITPEQEAALAVDSTIRLETYTGEFQFKLSDDPKYTPGNTSVKVVRENLAMDGVRTYTASLKWGKGQLAVSSKTNAVINPVETETKLTRAPGHPSSTRPVTTQITNGSPVEATAYLSYDATVTTRESIKADGSQSESQKISLKSRMIVDEPILIP